MPTAAEALQHGWKLHQQKQWEAAEHIYREVIKHEPKNAAAWCYLGIVLHDRKKYDAAVDAYHEALRIQPVFPVAWNNLGNSLRYAKKPEQAELAFLKAIEQKPDYVNAHKNRGTLHTWNGRFELALQCFRDALALQPNEAELHRNVGIIGLLQGRFEEGWREYRWRWNVGDLKRPDIKAPVWEGQDLQGKTIFLYPEQGLGDSVQFVRVASELKQRGATTVVQCQNALVPLMHSCIGIDHLIAQNMDWTGPIDFHCSYIDAADRLQLDQKEPVGPVKYLKAVPQLVSYWGSQLSQLPPGPRVAICWQGNPDHQADPFRSVHLSEMQALGDVTGVQFLSLQHGYGSDQASLWNGKTQLAVIDTQLDKSNGAFMDTAAILHHVDLLVTVDTAIGHVAGSLGIPTWLALHYVPDWRWRLDRVDTPWYPQMRLFRQPAIGDWKSVFTEMATQLKTVLNSLRRGNAR